MTLWRITRKFKSGNYRLRGGNGRFRKILSKQIKIINHDRLINTSIRRSN